MEELLTIHDLHRQGLGVRAIARRSGLDRKTVRKYLDRGLVPPSYGRGRRGRACSSPITTICASA
jgi:transposase